MPVPFNPSNISLGENLRLLPDPQTEDLRAELPNGVKVSCKGHPSGSYALSVTCSLTGKNLESQIEPFPYSDHEEAEVLLTRMIKKVSGASLGVDLFSRI